MCIRDRLLSGVINYNPSSSTGELDDCSREIAVNNVTVQDSSTPQGSKTKNFKILIRPQALKIITETLPAGYEGSPYNATISASGGRTSYTWSMSVSPSCPSGLTCSGNSIIGTPASGTAGTYTVTSTVNDTCTTNTRNFALTINPSGGGGGGCVAYRVWNQTGATQDFTVSGTCRNNRANGAEITTTTITLNAGGSISRHTSTVGNCTSAIVQTLTYAQAVAADTDIDCQVNFTLSGFTDR